MRKILATGAAFCVLAFAPVAANAQDPVAGAIVGGTVGAVVAGPPGAVVGGLFGATVGAPPYRYRYAHYRSCWRDRYGHRHCGWR